MRVLVTGAGGFLGWHLLHFLHRSSVQAMGMFRRPPDYDVPVAAVFADLSEPTSVMKAVRQVQPTHVIHAAALSRTDLCEQNPVAANAINAGGTGTLMDACSSLDEAPYVLYMSTDLVFDGESGPYTESDYPSPTQPYGASKAAGEMVVRISALPAAILRSTLIYGDAAPGRGCFLQWMAQGIRDGNGRFFDDEWRNPIWVDDLCRAILLLLTHQASGVYHAGGDESLSRWEFASRLARYMDADLLPGCRTSREAAGLAGSRPKDVTLRTDRLRRNFGWRPSTLETAFQAMEI